MAVALQPKIVAVASGHLSNEIRRCRDSTSWEIETFGGKVETWRITGGTKAATAPLMCSAPRDLTSALRSVATFLSDLPYRHHLEWVWDGERLWIVQCDRVPGAVGPSPGELWQPITGSVVTAGQLSRWYVPDASSEKSERWRKLESRREFARAGLPTADVFVLSGEEVIASLAIGEVPDDLIDDMSVLSEGHVVLRCDVADHEATFMLPKTTAMTDPDQLIEWLTKTAGALVRQGVKPADLIFVAHRFLRSRACAWSYADPGSSQVSIDSLWGLPDGLNWLPHDRSTVYLESGDVRTSIQGKPSFLDVMDDSSWTYRESPADWIWRSTLTRDQARSIARGAHDLAIQARRPVLTMWFVGLLDGAESDLLPWFQALWELGEGDQTPARTHGVTQTVSCRDDLDQVAAKKLRGGLLRLRPDEDLIRDKAFVDGLATIALEQGLTVEIDGSPLAHPYYILRRAGVSVVCRSSPAVPNSDELFNKLVRDQIPTIIEGHGERAEVYRASAPELRTRLRYKVVEEALELLAATSSGDQLSELADLQEVVDALIDASEWSADDLLRQRRDKVEDRGGFEEGYVLLATGDVNSGTDAAPTDVTLPGMPPVTTARTIFRARDDALIMSLIPPMPGEQQIFVARVAGRIVTVTYSSGTVEVQLREVPDRAPRDLGQPDLWS